MDGMFCKRDGLLVLLFLAGAGAVKLVEIIVWACLDVSVTWGG